MADIELVIKLPEEMCERIKDGCMPLGISRYLKNSIPLPKGHGDLIDIKDLLDQICLEDTPENRECNMGEIITLEDLDRIDAIISADKEG